MPKPKPSNYPKDKRWRFLQRSIPNNQLIEFANALLEVHNKELMESLPKVLHFAMPNVTDIDELYYKWQGIWVNQMHQMSLGYTVTTKKPNETRIFATELSRYLADTKNTEAYYYYWALRFQYPFSIPKQIHYLKNGVAVQPVVLICQYLEELSKTKLEEGFLTYYEIAQFLMKSKGHSLSLIKANCSTIILNRKNNYSYQSERSDPGFEEAACHLYERGRLFIGNFNLLTFLKDRITLADPQALAKIRTFLSYRQPPFVFNENIQDVRNEFFVENYIDLNPDPEILFDSVNSQIPKKTMILPIPKKPITKPKKGKPSDKQLVPLKLPITVVNPSDTRATFGTGTRAERKFQQRLKRDMLALYNAQCCICGLDRQEFLIASHIVAVNVDPSVAADRRNCLLLCVLHDKAMEKGYFGLNDDYTIIANHNKSLLHPIMKSEIAIREGQKIQLPIDKTFFPSVKYLNRHRITHKINIDP